jgi:ATP-dependent RNA helicase RhlE
VTVSPAASTVDEVEQRVYFVDRSGKPELLAKVLSEPGVERALVFTRTKRGADRVARKLTQDGIRAEAIHGNKSQGQRERTLLGFRKGKTRVLVATDIAARGIDIDGITHVVNYELPNVPESYVHRIGRTARAGATGIAISLCDGEERAFLRDIERLIRRKVDVAGGSSEALSNVRSSEGREHRRPQGGRGFRGSKPQGGPRNHRSHGGQGGHGGHGSRGGPHRGGSFRGAGPRAAPAQPSYGSRPAPAHHNGARTSLSFGEGVAS